MKYDFDTPVDRRSSDSLYIPFASVSEICRENCVVCLARLREGVLACEGSI